MIEIFVDADACPLKDEVYRVAARYDIYVVLVANMSIRTPKGLAVAMVVVDSGPDEADNWIADGGWRNIELLAANRWNDPILNRPEFVAVRERLGFAE